MTVTHFERLKFKVTSRTGSEPYTVDLGSFRLAGVCNGKCDCEDFRIRIFKRMKEAREAKEFEPGDKYRCPHIRAARTFFQDYYLDNIVNDLRTKYNDYTDEEW